jgi:BrxA
LSHPLWHILARSSPPHDQARPAQQLKVLLKKGIPSSRLNQLFLVYTARANPILHDFITHIYWAKYATGASQLTRDDSLRFVKEAAQMGLTEKPWSETMRIRVARYLLGCLTDFNLAGPDHGGRREILPLRISSFTTIYLAHDLHFSGSSDSGLLDHRDWKLFGLETADVLRELQDAAAEGHFIPQYAGDLLRISWKHKTMEECLCALS